VQLQKRLIIGAVVILAIVAGLSWYLSQGGHQPTQSGDTVQPTKSKPKTVVINTPDQFVAKNKEWAAKLETMAGETKSAYTDWSNGTIKTDEFKSKISGIYEKMEALNKETDFGTEVDLKASDQKKADYEQINKAYLKASKDLNDFLYMMDKAVDEQIKPWYEQLITEKYDQDVAKLKTLLEAQETKNGQ
jgi:hypothetical protein